MLLASGDKFSHRPRQGDLCQFRLWPARRIRQAPSACDRSTSTTIFVGDKPTNITSQIKQWRNACGVEGWEAVGVIGKVIEKLPGTQRADLLTRTNTRRKIFISRWMGCHQPAGGKNHRALENYERETSGNQIVKEIAPEPRDIVIVKHKPSGLFGTPLLSFLNFLQVDTLLVCGVSTSGCVRATVTDAFQQQLTVSA